MESSSVQASDQFRLKTMLLVEMLICKVRAAVGPAWTAMGRSMEGVKAIGTGRR